MALFTGTGLAFCLRGVTSWVVALRTGVCASVAIFLGVSVRSRRDPPFLGVAARGEQLGSMAPSGLRTDTSVLMVAGKVTLW